MPNELKILLNAIASLEDARAYLTRLELLLQDKRRYPDIQYLLHRYKNAILRMHDNCTDLVPAFQLKEEK